MRHSRLTYTGAYHHVMNRGDKGENIFPDSASKRRFLTLLQEKSKIYRIAIYAHCVMDNHFHLVIQNTSGRMSEFMRVLDGQYALHYRGALKGKGYVFQDRYKSILIGEGKYLRTVIIYVLLNPVRGGITRNPYEYRWSSICEYYTGHASGVVVNSFVEELFGGKEELDNLLRERLAVEEMAVRDTRLGKILGDDAFIEKSLHRFNRRREQGQSKGMRYGEEKSEAPDCLIRKFEIEKGIRLDQIDYDTKAGRMIRYELLRLLKEQGGMKYRQIVLLKPFSNLKFSSLGQMYKRAKERGR